MAMPDQKYDKLSLDDGYLADELLLALAWKKAHSYIRTTNWYADNFELDISAIDLPNRCAEWANEIKGQPIFKPLELVPAPKSCSWEFTKPAKTNAQSKDSFCLTWEPLDSEKLKLRPLAHIGIQEQTVMTLVMMCLADEVETAQGDPSTPYEEVHDKKVSSYGNRLYCTYKEEKAEHSYGATTVYSKFFQDYRRFLKRPYHFAREELAEKSENQEVYLVELDLSQFFDRVNREELAQKLRDIANSQKHSAEAKHEATENVLKAFINWEWSEKAKSDYEVCATDKVSAPPTGLPQGLVAAGFLANVYMSDFDQFMRDLIGEYLSMPNQAGCRLRLADYCRYVDDMRLVLVGPSREKLESENHIEDIKKALLLKITPKLEQLHLEDNVEKTNVETFRGKSIGISKSLEDIQSDISGPISFEDAEEHVGQLESLLVLSTRDILEQSGDTGRINRLATIEKDIFDVPEDTLKRFSANKISRLLNDIRHFTAREADENNSFVPGNWDYLQERIARRFIGCWSHEPALVLLLKKGLELFPSNKLLTPVLEQICHLRKMKKFSTKTKQFKQAAIADYCLAEIFRHSATVIHRKDLHAIPAHANRDEYFEVLQDLAVEIVSERMNVDEDDDTEEFGSTEFHKKADPEDSSEQFNFLIAQAQFLLLVRRDTTLESHCGNESHGLILKLTKGFRSITVPLDFSARDIAAAILIASQLVEDQKPLLRAAASLLKYQRTPEVILEFIANQDIALCKALLLHARPLQYDWLKRVKTNGLDRRIYLNDKPSAKPLDKIQGRISIHKLLSRTDNPLCNEMMAIKLMLALLANKQKIRSAGETDLIDLAGTEIQFPWFSYPPKIEAFDTNIEIKKLAFHQSITPLSHHLQKKHDDSFVLQRVALCLRAVLAGSGDQTGFGHPAPPNAGYRGLRSTQFKRQLALLSTPEALAGEAAQFSSWITTLISKLLKWPGIKVNDQSYDWPQEFTVKNVFRLGEDRLLALKTGYCELSGIPGLTERISPDWHRDKKSLTVAMVQSKMPAKEDFSKYGPLLNDPIYRTKHRRHIARVAELVTKHIEAQHLEAPDNGEREQNIDLIIWPELGVHQEDLDILIQLSRKTHSIVLAGLGFLNQRGVVGPNNCAVWIVPRKHNGNQNEILRFQGKHHMMEGERDINIKPWRPYQLMLELIHPNFRSEKGFVVTGAICFDATDISFSADMRDKSNALLIPALNRDVNTFDSMIEAIHYHIYQHVVLVNTGQYGGSYAMAPYDEKYRRLIAHSSGNDQVAINTFEMNMFDFRRDGVGSSMQSGIKQKTAPAGVVFTKKKRT